MASDTKAAPRSATGLQPDEIVEVAYALISEHGLDWFSMRKLAAALDVNPMTVYLRFDSKDDLLDAVARRGLAAVELPDVCRDLGGTSARTLPRPSRPICSPTAICSRCTPPADRLSAAVLQAVEQGLRLMEEVGYRDDRRGAGLSVTLLAHGRVHARAPQLRDRSRPTGPAACTTPSARSTASRTRPSLATCRRSPPSTATSSSSTPPDSSSPACSATRPERTRGDSP